ncbi:ScbA/BarX family gamma-butyrolactone biosynthesis protein [Streptomyces sp. NPDC019890]|uniref:ScbA/BarX family gamma-butyrolactone biosynthesis protein n=1 Tax=Streptomyces sp. NPDC019890 TaxID=3365064 RepID=UPI003850C5C9
MITTPQPARIRTAGAHCDGYTPAPPTLTHRTREQDTFATAWTAIGERHFRVKVRLPHDHPFFAPVPGGIYDPLLIVETMRQSSIMVSHAALRVPLEHHFMLLELEFACRPEYLRVGPGPAEMELDVLIPKIQYSAGLPSQFQCDWILRRDAAVAATGTGRTRLATPHMYRRLREGRTLPPTRILPGPVLAPRTVGRQRAQDVLLAPGDQPQQWPLALDTCHPTLFQRPNDHIPGMLLLEAARQAAGALHSPRPFVPSAGRITFRQYAEFGSPCLIKAGTLPGAKERRTTRVQVGGVQDERAVFSCVLEAPAVMH